MFGCINTGCKAVFGQWVSSKLKQLALVGFTSSGLCLILIALTISLWRKLSHGNEKIMWHNRPVEFLYLGFSFVIVLAVAIATAVLRPESP